MDKFPLQFFAAFVWLKSENVAGTAGEIQEGIAVDPLLARAGWNLAILVWCGRGATTIVAVGHILNTLLSRNALRSIAARNQNLNSVYRYFFNPQKGIYKLANSALH
ncbi:hypothetical protein ACWXWU_12470 [Shewanella sp. A14]